MKGPIKAYTVYIIAANGNAVFSFDIDGTNKKIVAKMAKQIALTVETYYQNEMWSIGKVSVKVEERKATKDTDGNIPTLRH